MRRPRQAVDLGGQARRRALRKTVFPSYFAFFFTFAPTCWCKAASLRFATGACCAGHFLSVIGFMAIV
jgi:hypothetical protein